MAKIQAVAETTVAGTLGCRGLSLLGDFFPITAVLTQAKIWHIYPFSLGFPVAQQ